ncbi:hypothetical protein [Kitasatospora sp. NPDC051914]|uniref:hypothetical protein n=1 Tax=Kitasatospora sp. NPDC051914 TaxID=3154945 RepID=UPI0034458894
MATSNGTDAHGVPRTMNALEPADVVNGKITRKRSSYQDTVLLRDTSLEREAVLAQEAAWA